MPLLRELPGFREYYLVDGGPNVLISIDVFDSADEALASNLIAANWIRNNVLEFMQEVMVGNVLVTEANSSPCCGGSADRVAPAREAEPCRVPALYERFLPDVAEGAQGWGVKDQLRVEQIRIAEA